MKALVDCANVKVIDRWLNTYLTFEPAGCVEVAAWAGDGLRLRGEIRAMGESVTPPVTPCVTLPCRCVPILGIRIQIESGGSQDVAEPALVSKPIAGRRRPPAAS